MRKNSIKALICSAALLLPASVFSFSWSDLPQVQRYASLKAGYSAAKQGSVKYQDAQSLGQVRADNHHGGGLGSFALGLDHDLWPVRFELEWTSRKKAHFIDEFDIDTDADGVRNGASVNDFYVKSRSLMFQFYYNIPYELSLPYEKKLTPFVNLGVGVAFNSTRNSEALQNYNGTMRNWNGDITRKAAYSAGGGFSLKLTDYVDLSLGYKYTTLGQFNLAHISNDQSVTMTGKVVRHDIYSGIRYIF